MIKINKLFIVLLITNITIVADPLLDHMQNRMDLIEHISNWFEAKAPTQKRQDEDIYRKSCSDTVLCQLNAKFACAHVIPITPADIGITGFTISLPGEYCLTQSTVFSPIANNLSAITINSNNVILHLNNNVLSKGGTATGISGVTVNGRQGVVIDGGTISNFNQYGIQVNPASSYVYISRVNATSCGAATVTGGGIGIASAVGSVTHDVYLDYVNASGNIFTGLTLAGVSNALITHSKFNNNTGTVADGGAFNGVWGILATPILNGVPCTNVTLIESQLNGNTSTTGAIGFESVSVPVFGLPSNFNFNIIRCEANSNAGGGSPVVAGVVQEGEGIVLAGTKDFVVENCIAQSNQTLAAAPSGISGNFASVGFGVPFSCANGSFVNCVAQNNSGLGDISTGFRATHSNQITFKNCISLGHTNTAGQAWGYTTDTNVGNPTAFDVFVNNNFVFDACLAEKNISTSGSNGGFKFIGQVNSILSNCTTVSNGIGILAGDPTCCPASCTVTGACSSTNNIISSERRTA